MNERGAVKGWILAFVLTAGLGLGGFIGIGCLVGANTCPGSDPPKFSSTDGRVLYVQATCAGCHGLNGEGAEGPALASGPSARLSVDEIVTRITNGRRLAGMPKFEGILTEAQIRAVADYVITLRGGS